MKVINYIYQNEFELQNFINETKIINANSVLVQLFASGHDVEKIKSIRNYLKENLSNAAIIGTTTAGIINNNTILDNQITISFSLFEKSTVKAISY